MSRDARLAARRLELLARCDVQRTQIADRLEALNRGPLRWLHRGATFLARPGRYPVAWLAAAGGLLLFGRTRRALSALGWARAALSLVTRGAELAGALGALGALRRPR